MSLGEILELALKLSREEQMTLIRELIIQGDPGDGCTEEEWEAAWGKEIMARLERMDRGESVPRPWRESIADIRERLKRNRQA
jgi:hypothetical protein